MLQIICIAEQVIISTVKVWYKLIFFFDIGIGKPYKEHKACEVAAFEEWS
jgi:hypothetical protein